MWFLGYLTLSLITTVLMLVVFWEVAGEDDEPTPKHERVSLCLLYGLVWPSTVLMVAWFFITDPPISTHDEFNQ